MPALQTLTASRNATWAPQLAYDYAGAALPLNGATIEMQLRFYPGQPGDPKLSIEAPCVGIAETKTLAKLANAAAKTNPEFAGVADLRDDDVRRDVMHAFNVGDVWGVGGATARKLNDLGIHTAGALRDMPMKQARAVGTVVLERLVAELRGVPSNAVEAVEPRRKGMAVTRSFGTPIRDFEQLMGALSQYALRAGEKLRSHGLVAARLTTFFHTNRHKPDRPQYGASRMVTLHPMTNDSLELIAAARRGAEKAWRDG